MAADPDLRREGHRDAARALRPATAKAAASAQGKLATRLSPGEKNGRKRMAELACVYDAAPVPRAPEDIISTPAQKRRKKKAQAGEPKGRGTPREPQARASGRPPRSPTTSVIAAAFDEAERRDPGYHREWAVLIDGDKTQIEAVTAEAARRGVTVTIIIDFIHVPNTAGRPPGPSSTKASPPPRNGRRPGPQDPARKVRAGRSRDPPPCHHLRYSPAERAGVGECARYLQNKQGYLGYATALAKGWPIATGIIESAAGTSSRTGWTSQARDGALEAPRPS